MFSEIVHILTGLKKIIRKIHLLLGLSSGLIVFIVAITGCVYCFQDEIRNATEDYRFVKKRDIPYKLPTELAAVAEKELPGKSLHSVQYNGPEKAAIASFYNGFGEEPYYWMVFLDPYSGRVLKTVNENETFFRFILDGHYYLWLPPAYGQPVVAISTLIFTIMLISGIILWWPKKNNRKQRFKVKWNARWRRKNYDLHAVFGFYASMLALVFALTGLVWGFQWFQRGTYFVASGGEELVPYYELQSSGQAASLETHVNQKWIAFQQKYGRLAVIDVHIPHDALSTIEFALNPRPGTYYKTSYFFYDQKTLERLYPKHIYGEYAQTSGAGKLLRMNYDIHVGAILGLPGKILAFCISLIIASLPVTGFLIWYGRKFKKKEPKKRVVASAVQVNARVKVLAEAE